MQERSDLRETILQVSTELFATHGYAATSIKQIAEAAGCTSAALYYHFADGKAHILSEVVRRHSREVLRVVDDDATYDDLSAYLTHLARRIGGSMQQTSKRMSWLVLEVRNLSDEERDQFQGQFQGQFLSLQRAIRTRLAQYLEDREGANMLAWIIVCSFLGYGQLFYTMGFEDASVPTLDAYGQALMSLVSVQRR